jgi:hypothetical protein
VVDEEEDETPGLLAEVGKYEGTKALVTVRSCINGEEECPRERGKERGGKREGVEREGEPTWDGTKQGWVFHFTLHTTRVTHIGAHE